MAFSSVDEFEKLGRLPREIWADDEDDVRECLEVSCEDVLESFRAAGIDLPIPAESVSRRIKEIECWLAVYRYMFDKIDPTNEADKKIETRWKWAREWLDKVAAKLIFPLPLTPEGAPVDATPEEDTSAAVVVAEPARGWNSLLV